MRGKYILVSGAFFGLAATGQAIRALNQWPVQVAGLAIPVWASWIACTVLASLCAWAFLSKSD